MGTTVEGGNPLPPRAESGRKGLRPSRDMDKCGMGTMVEGGNPLPPRVESGRKGLRPSRCGRTGLRPSSVRGQGVASVQNADLGVEADAGGFEGPFAHDGHEGTDV